MLMMRLQRVGRKNDPSFRIVVVDKRTGPKSNKNIDILGSYNPKMDHVQIDVDKAKDWLSKGVQPSDTVHNILVGQKVIDAKKINVLPRKSPIVDEEAVAKEKEEAEAKKAAAETAEATKEEASEASTDEAPVEEKAEESAPEATEEAPVEETKEEAPAEAEAEEEKKEAA